MCGICGVISADPQPVEPAVRAMMRAMVHRGPDDEGFALLSMGEDAAATPVVGVGFRRLSILDLSSTGHQPMFNDATGDCLVFNGEIYNFRQLRAELQCEGVVFRGTSDTEVLLQSLAIWGDAAVEKLNGMYAFAYYHAASRRMLLARDPLGIKPLYLSALPNRLVFASEIRPLLGSGLVSKDLDMAGISGMLAYGAVQSPRTVYQHIRSFPAGHLQWLDAGVVAGRHFSSPRRFWFFPSQLIVDDENRAATRVQQILGDAVKRQLVADVPVGIFLSAGIDSTVIALLAREHNSRISAFTVGFGPIHGVDEMQEAAATARELGVQHVPVSIDAGNLPDHWHDWLDGMDSPSVDGFNTYVVSRRLSAEGVVVGLSGLGADEMFGGYSTFPRAIWGSVFLAPFRFIPRGMWRQAAAALDGVASGRSNAEKMLDLIAGEKSAGGVARSLRRILSNSRIKAMGVHVNQHAHDDLEPSSVRSDAFNAVSQAELVHYMGNTLLRDTDINSMRHCLEVRVPFLDLQLVNYVSALPGKTKYRTVGKHLLRRAFSHSLPAHVAQRPKTGFALPVGKWMRNEMRESSEASLANLKRQSPLDPTEIDRFWKLFIDKPESTGWLRPMALVALGAYLK